MCEVKLHSDYSSREEAADTFEQLDCRVNSEADVLAILQEDVHDAFEVKFKERVDFLYPDILVSECIQAYSDLFRLLVDQKRCDVLLEHESEVSAAAGVLSVLIVHHDHGEEHLGELHSIQELLFLVLLGYYALTLRIFCHRFAEFCDDLFANRPRLFNRKDTERVQDLGQVFQVDHGEVIELSRDLVENLTVSCIVLLEGISAQVQLCLIL